MMYKLPMVVPITGEKHQIPWVHFQNTAFRSETRIQQAELMIFDMRDGSRVDLKIPKPLVIWEPTPKGGLRWSDDGRSVFAAPGNPDGKTLTAYVADALTGKARAVMTDTLPAEISPEKRFSYVDNGKEVIVYSMRSDWGHLYPHDGATGVLKNAITQGEWAVHDIRRIDAEHRWVYFTAGGREPGRHPDDAYLYRVHFDGSELTLLTPEDADHSVRFDGRYFIDTYSTVTTPPVTVLRSADGHASIELARADISALKALGWREPQPFTVKSADGKTDLYGVLFLPYDFDPSKSYPIIEPEYMGGGFAPRRFLEQSYLGAMALAQVGFVTILFDGREQMHRSAKQRLATDPNTTGADASFFDDHIAAMRQLAARHSFIDIKRTGIYGHSNGGWRAARALLQHPEFFKVGVATAGSHDYGTWINTGYPQAGEDPLESATNMQIADQLQGKLLLMHGYLDDDVHPAQTLQLAEALIQANKDFDMLVLPTYEHKMFWKMGYANRKAWDYFVENLLQLTPPTGVRIPDSGAPPYRRQMHPDE